MILDELHREVHLFVDSEGKALLSEQSIKAIAEAVVKKLTEVKHGD